MSRETRIRTILSRVIMAAPIANCPLMNASRTIVKAKFGKLK